MKFSRIVCASVFALAASAAIVSEAANPGTYNCWVMSYSDYDGPHHDVFTFKNGDWWNAHGEKLETVEATLNARRIQYSFAYTVCARPRLEESKPTLQQVRPH